MNEQITRQIRILIGQLQEMLKDLTDEEYRQKIELLSNASIGQHIRHITAFFAELFNGYENGTIDYEQRKRNVRIETDREYAHHSLQEITLSLDYTDKPLILLVDVGSGTTRIMTNFYRELLYNLEHAVHHMALLRIGVSAVSNISLPPNFGVAASTIKYKKACVQ